MIKYQIDLQQPNSTEWSPLKSWARPFTDGTTLDETLDEGCIRLSCTTRSEPIPPFSKIRIKIFDSKPNGDYEDEPSGEIVRVVGTSKRTRRTFAASSPTLWDWEIQTLEETKLLERYICDSMTSTNYLTTEFPDNFGLVFPTYSSASDEETFTYPNEGFFYGPQVQGSKLIIYRARDVFKLHGLSWGEVTGDSSIVVKSPSGDTLYSGLYEQSTTLIAESLGTYQVIYTIKHGTIIGQTAVMTFTIDVVEAYQMLPQPTITSVCERLLSAGITRRRSEPQKFTLDPVFAAKYADVPSPEFSFTRQTLFEALLTVGGYIHAIPRLNGNVVTFDELGGDDEIDLTNFPKQVYCDKVQTINDFCSTIDSPAQNLLNTQDRVRGAITELGNDYITVRAEEGEVIVDADTAIIRTSLPINQIVKLECGFIDGQTDPVGDITPYVYEAAEYDVLSGYWGTYYPYSKGWALRYSQGDNKITGLGFKLNYPTSLESALNNPSIINIIQAVTGIKISSTTINKLAFKVTYVPVVTSRVTQRKPYGDVGGANNGAGWDNNLVYNQGGNVVESSFYGSKMMGAIARLGNEVEQRTYDFKRYSQLPKCGQKLDGKYIARVDAEYDITRIRATLTLTKDFNMLSEYVGLNSNIRLYDISEKQSVDRFINYSENIYVGDDVEKTSTNPILSGLWYMMWATLGTQSERISGIMINGLDKDGNGIGHPVVLPVVSFGFGNSLVFSASMYDNYGAGYQNSNNYTVGTSEADREYKGVQRLVPYADGLGEVEYILFQMFKDGWNPTAAAQEEGGYANLYPQYIEGSIDGVSSTPSNDPATLVGISTGTNGLVVEKDSREALNLVYQVHFVANRDSIVLGPSLAQANCLTSAKTDGKFALYFFNHKLNMLDKIIDLTGAKYVGDFAYFGGPFSIFTENSGEKYKVIIGDIKNEIENTTYQAWGIVQINDASDTYGKLFIGENVELAYGVTAPNVYFTVRSNKGTQS